MGREVRRVPLDFDWAINEVWEGFLQPDKYDEEKCPDCKNGYSAFAEHLHDQWYGYAPFDPALTGSTYWGPDSAPVRAFAERNVQRAPQYYGAATEIIVAVEAERLARECFNSWSHHLSQADVDALVEAGRLMDFTHTWIKGEGWVKKDPMPEITAAQVNEWSIGVGMGHDAINQSVVIRARCEAAGVSTRCTTCDGNSTLEKYPGQRAEGEAWAEEDHDPPTGEGWQLWETVSEGSPISPVFTTPEELARWMASPEYKWGVSTALPYENALAFVKEGWAPSMVMAGGRLQSGEEWVGSCTCPGPTTSDTSCPVHGEED